MIIIIILNKFKNAKKIYEKKVHEQRFEHGTFVAYHAGPLPLRPPGRLAIEKTFRYINCYTKFEALFLGTGGLWGPMA